MIRSFRRGSPCLGHLETARKRSEQRSPGDVSGWQRWDGMNGMLGVGGA